MSDAQTPASPLVSAIITTHNGREFVGQAIDSVMHQDYANIELIVVDDASDDGSDDIARSYGPALTLVSVDLRDAGAARNEGTRRSRGELISLLDHDDVWMPEKTSAQVAALATRPEIGVMFGGVEEFRYGSDAQVRRKDHPQIAETAGRIPSAAMIRRSVLDAVGPFKTGWQVGDWADWYARAQDAGVGMGTVPDVVTRRGVHDDNMTLGPGADMLEYVRVARESLQRRRARGPHGG